MFDTHIHTLPYSTDSGMTFPDLLAAQKERDLGVILTEHIDYAFGDPSQFCFDPEVYFKELSPYRNDRLLLGVEIGMTEDTNQRNQETVRSHPFDMVIGSIHFIRSIDIYYPEFFAMFASKEESYREYLEVMAQMVTDFDDFDTLGHIDYISRVAPYKDALLYYDEYPELFDRILSTLVKKDKCLEINTRLFDGMFTVAALKQICMRYRDLGGRYVTIGSDAHYPENVGCNLVPAYAAAGSWGLTPVYYRERKRVLID